MAMAAIAAGADSLMIEVHPNPAKALSDGPQSLTIEAFEQLMLEWEQCDASEIIIKTAGEQGALSWGNGKRTNQKS